MTTQAPRFDSVQWRSDGLSRTPQGYLRIDGYATVFDKVLHYSDTGGEYRPPEEVTREDSLETLKNIPITWGHPTVKGKRVHLTPKNTSQFIKGYTTDSVAIEDDLIRVGMVITDEKLIDSIEKGYVKELSPGYDRNLDRTKGAANGQVFDGIQRDIVYNHLAVVQKGRSGSKVSLITDEVDFMIRVDEKEYEGAEAAQIAVDAAISAARLRADQAEADLKTAQADLSAEKARADKAEADLQAAQARLDEQELSALKDSVKTVLKDVRLDGLTAREIKEKYVQAIDPEVRFDGQDDQYVSTYFTITQKQAAKHRVDPVIKAYDSTGTRSDSQDQDVDPIAAAYQKQLNKMMGVS